MASLENDHRDNNAVDISVNSGGEAEIEASINLLRRRSPRPTLLATPHPPPPPLPPSKSLATTKDKEYGKTRHFFVSHMPHHRRQLSEPPPMNINTYHDNLPLNKEEIASVQDIEPEIDVEAENDPTEMESATSSSPSSPSSTGLTSHQRDSPPQTMQSTSDDQESTLVSNSTSTSSRSDYNYQPVSPPQFKSTGNQAVSSGPSSSDDLQRGFISQLTMPPKDDGPYRPPTKLHALCIKASSIDDLRNARSELLSLKMERKEILGWSGVRDKYGRTPMHLISENKRLAEHVQGGHQGEVDELSLFPGLVSAQTSFWMDADEPARELVATNFIVDFLLAANPSCVMSRDVDGKVPFEAAIANWINPWYDDTLRMRNHMRNTMVQGKRDSFHQTAPKAVMHALRSSIQYAARRTKGEGSMKDESGRTNSGHNSSSQHMVDSSRNSSNQRTSSSLGIPKQLTRSKCFPVNIILSSHMKFALHYLSKIIERLEQLSSARSGSRARKTDSNNVNTPQSPASLPEVDSFDRAIEECFSGSCAYDEIKEAIVSNIASIPDFIKTIFLLDNEEELKFALSTTIVKRVLMNKHSVGTWLTTMLQSGDKAVSGRAVDYLKNVSDISAAEKPQLNAVKTSSDLSRADNHRDGLHNEMSRLKDFVPSLLALGENGMEKAASSMVVRRVMDRIISRPFAVTIIFCDALFLALLIGGFRSAVNTLLVRGDMDKIMQGIYLANTGIFYFVIRELGKAISLCMITHRARDYLWSFWNLTDLTATLFSLASVIAIRSTSRSEDGLDILNMHGLRDFLAVTTGFLWLRVLNMLKGINMQMATFILAILQITRDTLSFGVILAIMVITFGQMFYTILIPDSCSSEEELEGPDYECNQSEYTFRVYTILLGEFGAFERETFKTKFSIFLLVFYSFMVIIVLLNVLIALASDSYEKCLMKSHMLFGRARVTLVAEIGCLENLLRRRLQRDDPTVSVASLNNNPKVYNKWWTGVPAFAKGWSRGSIVFFGLSFLVVFLWAIGEIAGLASGERHGHVMLSMASVFVNIILFAAMMLFLSHHGSTEQATGASLRSNLSAADSLDSEQSGALSYFRRFMLRLMGSSQDSWNHVRRRDQNQESMWRGRVHHLQNKMDQSTQEARDIATQQSQALEQLVAATEMRLKADMASVERRVGDLKADLLHEMTLGQVNMLKQIQVILAQK